MKRPIKIEDMLFSDGTIEELVFSNNELKMLFRDYCDNKLLFFFNENVEAEEKGSIGLSVYQSDLHKYGNITKLRLLDDDLNEMLTIKFGMCRIEKVE